MRPLELSVVVNTALSLTGTLFVGVPVDIWNAFWISAEVGVPYRRDIFLSYMHLEIVTIVIGDPPVPVEVVRPADLPLWVELSLYVDTHPALCPSGCEYERFP